MLRFARATVEQAGQVVVERVSLEVEAGQALALIGRDGSGTTDLLEAAATAVRLHAGDIEVAGISIRRKPDEVRRRIGYVPAEAPEWPGVRAGEFLEVFAAAAGLRGTALVAAVERGLRRAGLSTQGRERLDALSRGRRRLLLIARALLHDPEVLLLDDPFAGLDPTERDGIERLVEDTHLVGRTVLATIIDADVPTCFTHLAWMAEGRIVAMGPLDSAAFSTGRAWMHRAVRRDRRGARRGGHPGRVGRLPSAVAGPAAPRLTASAGPTGDSASPRLRPRRPTPDGPLRAPRRRRRTPSPAARAGRAPWSRRCRRRGRRAWPRASTPAARLRDTR
jgi:ABC-type multidrug transport system ATPase subunit